MSQPPSSTVPKPSVRRLFINVKHFLDRCPKGLMVIAGELSPAIGQENDQIEQMFREEYRWLKANGTYFVFAAK